MCVRVGGVTGTETATAVPCTLKLPGPVMIFPLHAKRLRPGNRCQSSALEPSWWARCRLCSRDGSIMARPPTSRAFAFDHL